MRHLKSLAVTLSILLVLSVFPVISRADDGITEVPGVKVSIDGRNITFSDVVISSKGKTLLPLSELLASLGVPNDNDHIIWNGTEKSVTIIKDSIKLKLIQGNDTAYINDIPVRLDVPPVGYSKNGKTYIPTRFVAQSLGKTVTWDDATKTVVIKDPRLVTVANADELAAAIGSDTRIILKKGIYDLSKIKQEFSKGNVFLEKVSEGNRLIIKGVRNLTLEGEGDTPAELVAGPGYANVLSFRDSANITLRNIKAGHTSGQGEGTGSVLVFDGSSNISIFNSELYGSGIEGLTLSNTNNLLFANSAINNCDSSIMTLNSSKDISFYKSRFTNNRGYSYGIKAADNSSLTFDDSDFTGNQISGGYFFDVNLSRILVKNSRINNNFYPDLASDNAALTLENTKTEGNVSGPLSEAIGLYNEGRYEASIEGFDQYIATYPDDYTAYSFKGDALYFLGRYDEAIQSYDKVLAAPGQATAYLHYSKGAALYRLGNYKEAITCYDEALKLDPGYTDALNNKGDSLSNLGRYDEAIKAYNQVLAMEPENVDAMCGLVNISFYKGKYQEAIKGYDKLLERQPGYITGYINKGIALYRLGEYEDSLASFDKIINELNPDYADAYYYKAQSLAKLNRPSDAVESLRKAIELFPANKEYVKSDAAFDSLRKRDDFKELTQ